MDERLRALTARATSCGHLETEGGIYTARKMAKIMKTPKNFDANTAFKGGHGGGGSHPYKWDEWFSGDLVLLERSEGPENEKGTIEAPVTMRDYGVPQDAMFPKTKTAARRRYKVVFLAKREYNAKTGMFDGAKLENGGIILQARDMTPDERVAEDILRAEEKEKLKAKKAANGDTADDTDEYDSAIEPAAEPAQS